MQKGDELMEYANSFQFGHCKLWKAYGILRLVADMSDVLVGKRLCAYIRRCLEMEGFMPGDCDKIARWIETNVLPSLMPMVWADDPAHDDRTRCVCCDREIMGEPRHWVEATMDMGEAIRPGTVSTGFSGGFFPVGPVCAKKHFLGFTHSNT